MKQQLDSLVSEMVDKGILYSEARREFEKRFIARVLALNHLDRAAERMKRRSKPIEEGDPYPATERAAGPRGPSPLGRLESRGRLRRLADCFERLPAASRAVLALREGEDRAYEDIAALLGIELGTVRSRLARARLSLKECVEGGAR